METPGSDARRAGQIAFAVIFLAAAAILLALIGEETVWRATKHDWTNPRFWRALVAQPRFWPAVALIAMVLFGALHLRSFTGRRARDARLRGASPFAWRSERGEAVRWAWAMEYAAWFAGLVMAVPIIGFAPAAILFAVALAWRSGYRQARWLWIAAAFALATVLLFKGGLSVRIPGGAAYEWLPGPLRNFAIRYF